MAKSDGNRLVGFLTLGERGNKSHLHTRPDIVSTLCCDRVLNVLTAEPAPAGIAGMKKL